MFLSDSSVAPPRPVDPTSPHTCAPSPETGEGQAVWVSAFMQEAQVQLVRSMDRLVDCAVEHLTATETSDDLNGR